LSINLGQETGLQMSKRTLTIDDQIYHYLLGHTLREHPAQKGLRDATTTHPHAAMQISPEQGQLMSLLIKLMGARNTIEVGVFTGYSTLTVALSLPADGKILACDINEDYASIGKPYWQQAGVANKIEFCCAPALKTLDSRIAAGCAALYDFAFIDADKEGYDSYYERCLVLLRSGGLIAIDNTLWGGAVAKHTDDEATIALQKLNRKLHEDTRVDISMLPIGDGLTLVRKR
jgi:predicted O-methyltransferase YrrM